VAPTIGPSLNLHSLRSGQTIHKDHSKLRPGENDGESRGEQEDRSQDTLQQVLLAIQYEKDSDMDGNILYLTESAKELLPGYIKTSKGLILPREIYHTLTNIKGIEKEIGVVKDSVQITGLYSWGPPEIASRVEIDALTQYLKPYLDTTGLGCEVFLYSPCVKG
jgi:hypothetical protein